MTHRVKSSLWAFMEVAYLDHLEWGLGVGGYSTSILVTERFGEKLKFQEDF